MRNLGFALNDKDFSDRILHLKLVPPAASSESTEYADSDVDHKTVHVSSAVLASYSPFFYKLFKNDMGDSKAIVVNLEINASEETAFMDLLNYMYENTLAATSATELVNVLITAEKFEASSCMGYCIDMLLELPMTQESALVYLAIPSSVLASEVVMPLIDAAKKYAVARYKDFAKSREEAMELPLFGLQVVLGSEGLQVISEDDVYDFILEWARKHYPELEERREILMEHLVKLICFTNMSSSKIKEALDSSDFEHEQISKLVMKALLSKVELPFVRNVHVHTSKEIATTNQVFNVATTNWEFLGRIYLPHCFVYFDLKKDELKNLQPSCNLTSQTFCVGEKQLYLAAHHEPVKDHIGLYHFGLYLNRVVVSDACTLDFEFAVMSKSSKQFKSKGKSKNCKFEGLGWGWGDLLGISWTELMSDECEYFIDDVLHTRVEISVIKDF